MKQNKINPYISDPATQLAGYHPTLTFHKLHTISQQPYNAGKMSTIPIGGSPSTYHVVLIDDEAAARKVLRSFIESYCSQLKVIGEASGVQEGFKLIREKKPGLVFLDVEMGDGQGFDLLDKFEQPDFKVIFTTAHDRFAIKAFKYYAVGYLLKPIDPEDLVAAVDHVLAEQSTSGLLHLLQAIHLPQKEQVFDRMALPSSEGITMMDVKNIIRLESDAGYTTFYSSTGEKIMVTRSIGEFEDALPADAFFRVHVSHLVNLNFVKKYVREDGGYLIMENGQQVPIARRRKDEFLDVLKRRSAL